MEEIEKPKILIVDDKPQNLLALEMIFEDAPFDLIRASSGNEALAQIVAHEFAMVLLDVQMPEMDGFETAELIRNNRKTANTPIIFVTAISKEEKHIFKGYESGAVDYICKPFDSNILTSKVKIFMDLYRQKKTIEHQTEKLTEANKKILAQQESLVEEERIKVLLQMAGATAYELNQPLMILLENIERLQKTIEIPEKLVTRISAIEESGKRIADIVKRIQFIQHKKTNIYPGGAGVAGISKIPDILWVEDEDICFTAFKRMLDKRRTTRVTRADSIQQAKQLLLENPFDLAILDLSLPDGNSFELLTFIKKQDLKMGILILTGYGDEAIAASCIQAGAHGYLAKGNISINELHQKIESVLEKFRFDCDKEKAIAKMAEMSTRDELTGLYNRRFMQETLDQELERSRRYGSDLACMLFDLDHFKRINDTYGHACGDLVLKKFSRILMQNTRDSDYAFRYGGEEFMILLPQTRIDGARKAAEKIRKFCELEKYDCDGHAIHVTVSIGIASVNMGLSKHPSDLSVLADKALYRAKADGRNCVRVYQKEETSNIDNE